MKINNTMVEFVEDNFESDTLVSEFQMRFDLSLNDSLAAVEAIEEAIDSGIPTDDLTVAA